MAVTPTGDATSAYIIPRQSYCCETYIEKTVDWIQKPDRPLLYKIGVYALTFFAATVMTMSLIGIPFVYLGVTIALRRDEVASSNIHPSSVHIDHGRNELSTYESILGNILFNSTDKYRRLPIMDLEDRRGNNDILDFIGRDKFQESAVYRGVDVLGRPFLTMLVTEAGCSGRKGVATFYQRYTNNPNWICAGLGSQILDNANALTADNVVHLESLINGRHAKYRLA